MKHHSSVLPSRSRWMLPTLTVLTALSLCALLWQLYKARYIHPLPIDKDAVASISAEVFTGSLDSHQFEIDAPEQIQHFCHLWNDMYFAEVEPYLLHDILTASDLNTDCSVEIHYKDGSSDQYAFERLYVVAAGEPSEFFIWGAEEAAPVMEYLYSLEQEAP